MTKDNYHLLYGLHLLSKSSYLAIFDALLNNELQIEDLVRLGGYTDAEATKLLNETLGSWTNSSVSVASAGTDGYSYLMQTLGLASKLDDIALDIPLFTTNTLAGSHITIGGVNGHANQDEVEGIFNTYILDSALEGLPYNTYIPLDESEFRNLACPNKDIARQNQMWLWGNGIYDALLIPDDGYTLRKLISVGIYDSVFKLQNGLAGWVAESTRPASDLQLRIHREAASITVNGIYTDSQIEDMIEFCESTRPDMNSTSNSISELDFKISIIGGYLALNRVS